MNEQEIRAIVRAEIISIFTGQSSAEAGFTDIRKAWEPLGYPSYNAIYKDVKAGLLRPGKEVFDRRKPGAKLARWVVDIEAAKKRLREDPNRRRSV